AIFIYVRECEGVLRNYSERVSSRAFFLRFGAEATPGEARAQGFHLINLHKSALGPLQMRVRSGKSKEEVAVYFIEFGPLFTRAESEDVCRDAGPSCLIESPSQ